LSQFTRLTDERQTERTDGFTMTKTALHSTQRGKFSASAQKLAWTCDITHMVPFQSVEDFQYTVACAYNTSLVIDNVLFHSTIN